MDPIYGSYQMLTEQMECLIRKRLCKRPVLKGYIKKYLTRVQYKALIFLKFRQYLVALGK
jgi:hypothetical protein